MTFPVAHQRRVIFVFYVYYSHSTVSASCYYITVVWRKTDALDLRLKTFKCINFISIFYISSFAVKDVTVDCSIPDISLPTRDAVSLGLQLVSALVGQLQGILELEKQPHPVFTIRFPKPNAD
jgi:hypothetical protein